jgi:SHS2 domain-containing protein
MIMSSAGFREVEHTADCELEVWAPDLPGLFEQAARGMSELTGTRLKAGPRLTRRVQLASDDPESLLVAFLEELRYLGETEGLAFDNFEIIITPGTLTARLGGAPFTGQTKEIKAVTYHKLAVRQTGQGFEANIVFDI